MKTAYDTQTIHDNMTQPHTVEWWRLKSDVNGNPRFACHFSDLESFRARFFNRVHMTLEQRYERVIKFANTVGGKKYHNKQFGGCIVFQAYEHELQKLADKVIALGDAA